ncbi:DUF1753-domain-containing protein [Delitschia confertaspora ATCC 74209]|uniref:DUF1753-domain-containing protein n=1 Tax=Delitschia confertaspora ATCC 74209 TaxID=1513339 RepID=A0A9P4JHY9_9PLEO|nr:DUF1753-domain-containing protein [Delitschia confertaspora ATCC 74209]
MAPSHIFEIPRPKTFLHTMSLRTGAEIITFLQLINKATGMFGMLALLTGAQLSPLPFSMYLYSITILIATTFLYSHIKKQFPFQTLLLAHLYALDSIVNALYTAFFGFAWFMVLAQHPEDSNTGKASGITQNAGFTSPQYNVSSVNIVTESASGMKSGEDAIAVGQGLGASNSTGLAGAVMQSGSIMSILLISGFWMLRVYFVFVMLAFARQCLRQHIATHGSTSTWYNSNNQSPPSNLAENPFDEGKEEGNGWKGKLGRMMLNCAPQYWLGGEEDREWMRSLGGKFRAIAEPVGVNERERRRRSGTGPPAPPRELQHTRLESLSEVR